MSFTISDSSAFNFSLIKIKDGQLEDNDQSLIIASKPLHEMCCCTDDMTGFIPLLSQMRILDKFPIEGGQKDPKKRIIPFLPGDNHSDNTRVQHIRLVTEAVSSSGEKEKSSDISRHNRRLSGLPLTP